MTLQTIQLKYKRKSKLMPHSELEENQMFMFKVNTEIIINLT